MRDVDEMKLANRSQGPKMGLSRGGVRLSHLSDAWMEGERESEQGKQRVNRANRGCSEVEHGKVMHISRRHSVLARIKGPVDKESIHSPGLKISFQRSWYIGE